MTMDSALAAVPAAWPTGLADPALSASIAPFVCYEARLLDERRFDTWFDLFTEDSILVIALRPGGDPDRELTVTVDDRRRLADRIAWLQGDATWCQRPAPQTLRVIGSVEAWPNGEHVLVRSTLTLWVHRSSGTAPIPAEQLHLLCPGPTPAIKVKRLTPLGIERGLSDPSAVL